MKNTFKKMAALLMAVAMVITSMSITAFAASKVVTVKNVESGATVTAYKIVSQNATTNEWEKATGVAIEDVTAPTADEVTAIANAINAGTLELDSVELDPKDDLYQKEMDGAGLWIVLVSKTNSTKIYNPMLVAVDYDENAQLQGGTVDADGNFLTAYAKSSEPEFDKKITGKTINDNVAKDSTDKGDTLAVGDITQFEITATIPSYSKDYEDVMFEIEDTLSKGLDPEGEITVTGATADDYTLTGWENRHFKIAFKEAFLYSNGAKSITITYKAKLNKDAEVGFNANTNTATCKYSNDPANKNSKKEIEKKTYHYTFDIDGSVYGEGEEIIEGREVVKVGIDKYTGELVVAENTLTKEVKEKTAPLAGAEFELRDLKGNVVRKVTTDSAGMMFMTGLDAGEYKLVETKAPAGYALNDTEIPVSIKAELDPEDGTLKWYSVEVNGNNTTYTWNHQATEVNKKVTYTENTTDVVNTKLGTLPSTGGMGTIIFTIAGIAIMAIAAGLFIAKKKASK